MGKNRFKIMLILALLLAFVVPTSAFAENGVLHKENGNIKYLALGDSIAYGIGSLPPLTGYVYHYRDLLSMEAIVELENLAKPGLTSSGLLAQLKSLGEKDADLVTVSIGGNNVLVCGKNNFQAIDADCAASGLKKLAEDWPKIIAEIRSLNPDATIQVMNLYNPFAKDDPIYESAETIISQINSLLSSEQNGQYSVVDVHSAFIGKEKKYTYLYCSLIKDVHPTAQGHYTIAKLHYKSFQSSKRDHGDGSPVTTQIKSATGNSRTTEIGRN